MSTKTGNSKKPSRTERLVQARFPEKWMKDAVDDLARRKGFETGEFIRRVLFAEMKRHGDARVGDEMLFRYHLDEINAAREHQRAEAPQVVPVAVGGSSSATFVPAWVLMPKDAEKRGKLKWTAPPTPDLALELLEFVPGERIVAAVAEPLSRWTDGRAKPTTFSKVEGWVSPEAPPRFVVVGMPQVEWDLQLFLRALSATGAERPVVVLVPAASQP